MSYPRAFISFDFDNNKREKDLFIGQSKCAKTPFDIEDWSSKEHLPQLQWEKLISNKIAKCNMVIVLVGRQTASALGVTKEISFALSSNGPIFGIYVDGANAFSSLPEGLQKNRIITWNWEFISSAIEHVMKEGKNAI